MRNYGNESKISTKKSEKKIVLNCDGNATMDDGLRD